MHLFHTEDKYKPQNGATVNTTRTYKKENNPTKIYTYLNRRSNLSKSKGTPTDFELVQDSELNFKITEESMEVAKINDGKINSITDKNNVIKSKMDLDSSLESHHNGNKENNSSKANTNIHKNAKSSSFVNMIRPTLQEVRNKAKEAKLRNRQKMQSVERVVPDDSELVEDDESHINIKNTNYMSRGKTLRTINSINKEVELSKNNTQASNGEYKVQNNFKTMKSRSPIERHRISERTGSLSTLTKPYIGQPKTFAIDAFYKNNESESKYRSNTAIGSLKGGAKMSKTSKINITDRNLSNSRTHDRSRSNHGKNRHCQIKHESNNLSSMATFQKLMNNFPDIRCASTENLKETDKASIDRKASELKKYMSSGRSQGHRVQTCKSGRRREISPSHVKIEELCIEGRESDFKFNVKENDMFFKTSVILPNEQNDGNGRNQYAKRLSALKLSACQMNKGLPAKRLSQVPDTPSVEIDINDCIDDDDIHLSQVSEEIVAARPK